MIKTQPHRFLKPATERAMRTAFHLIVEVERAHLDRSAADARVKKYGDALDLLLDDVPEDERAGIQKRLDRVRSGVAATSSRGGEVHDNVVALFAQHSKREWTIPEIGAELAKVGEPVDPKAIHNAISYLAKTGRLRRISRGQYLVLGIGVGLEADGPGDDGTRRMTEHEI